MSRKPWLAWVTDRRHLGTDLPGRASALARAGVDLIQLRENDLTDGELLELARAVAVSIAGTATRLLINDRVDLALAAGAGGVHLKSDGLIAGDARALLRERLGPKAEDFLIGRACHGGEELAVTAREGVVDYVTLSPLHASGTKTALGTGGFARELDLARQAAPGRSLPTWLALGGAGLDDLPALAAMAAGGEHWGLAAVRLFQEPESDEQAAILARRAVAELPSPS